MNNNLRVGFVIIFLEDGLNKDAIRQELESFCTIVEESDGTILNKNGEEEPIYCYIMDGPFSSFLLISSKYNCESDPENPYYLYARNPGMTKSIFVQ